MTNQTYDIAIVGGGAAGLSAALVLARARRSVVVVDGGRPRNAPAAHMHGFLSRDGMPPAELLTTGRAEVTSYGGQVVGDTVTDVVRSSDGTFRLRLASTESIDARRLLVTTGLRDEVPDVPGIRERWGRDVLHCPYCHGHEVRDQPLGVLGGTPGAVQHALLLRQWSHDVVYFPDSTGPTAEEREQLLASAVGLVDGAVARLVVDDDALAGVRMSDGRFVPRTAVFVRPVLVPTSDLLHRLGADVDHEGWPVVDGAGRTTVPGVWAGGNAANPRAQVITAAGEGSAAAIAINNDLTEEDVRNAVRAFREGLPA
jgi:thioredoxin reductase